MARPAKVWYRADIGWWMITLGGVKTRLLQGPNDTAHRQLAEEKYVELRKLQREVPESVTARAVDLTEAFLRHSRIHFAADTHRVNRYYCQLFAEACGQFPARDIKPYHIARWIDPKVEAGEWGATTVYNARRVAIRIFSWAAQQGMIPTNPLKGLKNPKPKPRQRAMSEAEFATLLEYAGGPLHDILTAMYMTGARPKEVRELRWEMVRDDRWVLDQHKTVKATGKPRVIYLPQAIRDMMVRLRDNGHAQVFLNTEGNPWTMNALRLQVARIRTKAELPADVCPYLVRHSFGTRAILNGVSGPTLAELMGHSSLEMIQKVYVHLADQHEHLAAAAAKVNATPLPAGPSPTRKRAKRVPKEGPEGRQGLECAE